jgi:hypothetical protein
VWIVARYAASLLPYRRFRLNRCNSGGVRWRIGGDDFFGRGRDRLVPEDLGGPPLLKGLPTAYRPSMSPPPDQPPPPAPAKPKLTAEERRTRQGDRLTTIRLRMLIGRELDDRGITSPADIGQALGMPAAEATSLLTRRQWREGDVALLQAAAARLGVKALSGG